MIWFVIWIIGSCTVLMILAGLFYLQSRKGGKSVRDPRS